MQITNKYARSARQHAGGGASAGSSFAWMYLCVGPPSTPQTSQRTTAATARK